MDYANLWWENITGPAMLVQKLADSLDDGKSVILRAEGPLPWHEDMRNLVMHRLHRLQFWPLEWRQPQKQTELIPQMLRQLRPQYLNLCPPDYGSQLKFLREKQCFGNMIVWLSPDWSQDLSLTIRLISDYRGKNAEREGCFVLEIPMEQPVPQLSGRVNKFACKDYIRWGNIRLFSSMIADAAPGIPEELRSYAACVSATLSGHHAEWAPKLLTGIDFTREDPGTGLLRLWDAGLLTGAEGRPDPSALDQTVWRAQLQSVFAGIELERLKITERFSAEIEWALDTEYYDAVRNTRGYVSQWGDRISAASDVELGTLIRMTALCCANDHDTPLLKFPQDGTWEWVSFLRDCRNRLAHHQKCAPDAMACLLAEIN